jgi:hypothetical protein
VNYDTGGQDGISDTTWEGEGSDLARFLKRLLKKERGRKGVKKE